jgi:hypothetical protein
MAEEIIDKSLFPPRVRRQFLAGHGAATSPQIFRNVCTPAYRTDTGTTAILQAMKIRTAAAV